MAIWKGKASLLQQIPLPVVFVCHEALTLRNILRTCAVTHESLSKNVSFNKECVDYNNYTTTCAMAAQN